MHRPVATETFSIFGQIDAVVAQAMVDEGKLVKIWPDDIPATAAVHEDGRHARFAVVVPREHRTEFETRIKDLYL